MDASIWSNTSFGRLDCFCKRKIVGKRDFITCYCFNGRLVSVGLRERYVACAPSWRNHKYRRRRLGYLPHYKRQRTKEGWFSNAIFSRVLSKITAKYQTTYQVDRRAVEYSSRSMAI